MNDPKPSAAAVSWTPGLVGMWIAMVVCFGLVPGLLLVAGMGNIRHLRLAEGETLARQGLQRRLEAYVPAANGRRFWGSLLYSMARYVNRKKNPVRSFQRRMPGFGRRWGLSPIGVAWDGSGRLLWKSVPMESSAEDWKEVWEGLRANRVRRFQPVSDPRHRQWFATMRRLLGEQLLRTRLSLVEGDGGQPIFASLSSPHPYVWYWIGDRFGFLLFLPSGLLEPATGIRGFMEIRNRQAAGRRFVGLIRGDRLEFPGISPPADLVADAAAARRQAETDLETSVGTDRFLFEFKFLATDLQLVAALPRSGIRFGPSWPSWLGPLCACLLVLVAGELARRTLVPAGGPALSVKGKLALLFFLANGLPLLVIFFLGYDYLGQKQKGLETEIQKGMGEFLENYDRRFQAWNIRYERALETLARRMKKSLRNRELTPAICRWLQDATRPLGIKGFFLIASGSPLMGTERGLVRGESDRRSVRGSGKGDLEEGKFVSLLGRKVLREINGEAGARRGIDDLELLVESFLQKTLVEIIHDFFQALDKIKMWGFGESQAYSYLNILRTTGRNLADYFFVITWGAPEMQRSYLLETVPRANRNSEGFRLAAKEVTMRYKSRVIKQRQAPPEKISSSERRRQAWDESFGLPMTPALERFCHKLGVIPPRDPETIMLQGARYLASGILGKELDRFLLLAFYPQSNLETEIQGLGKRLLGFGLLSLLVTLVLVWLLGKKFLGPVDCLAAAALAIEHRRFDHRLPPLGNDEFGDLGRIFNRVLVGLEELQVAKVVQESLFPDGPLEIPGFRVFGRSLAMGELGGDCFDYFALEGNRLGVLIGDVAGHGLPAALTMAMARAGVLRHAGACDDPVTLLHRLNDLLQATRGRDRQARMTFQYARVDGPTRRAVLANAGHCPTLLIRGNGSAEAAGNARPEEGGTTAWLELPSPPLGASPNPVFASTSVTFGPGDVLVWFTDGLVGAADPGGRVLGYPGAADLVRGSWHPDPEKMCELLLHRFQAHLGAQDRQDDLTIVILACR